MTTPQSPLHLLQDPSLLKTAGYINGTWVQGPDTFAVTDPATGLELAQVANLTPTHTQQAIDAAEAALPAWRSLTHKQRSQLLRKWFDLIMAHRDDLARLMTAEQGKPLAEATGEVVYGATFVEWYAEEAKRTYGETVPSFAPDRRAMVLRQPIGVCAAITPWNFPVAMITRKVAPAIAAGCTVVVKPAEFTPLCALALAELAHRAGIPQGVINVVPTEHAAAVGKVLCDSPVVRHLSFTGSTEVGRILMAQCAPTIKKLALELGGNAPFIVFDDADLDSAVEGAMSSKYRNAGQTCVCANRFLVQRGVQDAFAEKLARAVNKLQVGNGLDAGVEIGPLINTQALRDVDSLVQDALAAGAELVVGGGPHTLGGLFYQPTILKNVTNTMPIAANEIFGPVAPLITFDTEAEGIALANDTRAGLAAYFYARDVGRIWRVAEGLEYGMVGINEGIISNAAAPFGGVKESGLGREGSRHGMDEYLEIKYLCFGGVQ